MRIVAEMSLHSYAIIGREYLGVSIRSKFEFRSILLHKNFTSHEFELYSSLWYLRDYMVLSKIDVNSNVLRLILTLRYSHPLR